MKELKDDIQIKISKTDDKINNIEGNEFIIEEIKSIKMINLMMMLLNKI